MKRLLAPWYWLRTLWGIVKYYDRNTAIIAANLEDHEKEIRNALHYIKKATKVHIKAGIDAQSTVIVCGQYRGKDHVQVFRIAPGSFEGLVEELREVQKYSTVEFIDAPEPIDATIKRQLER